VNGGFSDGLDSWQTSGGVVALDGLAVMTDTGVTRSLLWQTAPIPAGRFEVSFEFRNLFSGDIPPGTLPDTGFVSVFFFSNSSAFDPLDSATYDGAAALLDLDFNGPFNVPPGASLGPSGLGSDYVRYDGSFTNPGSPFAALVFDLVDLNFVNNDSAFVIDSAAVEPSISAAIDIAKAGEFIRITFQGALEMSANGAVGSWAVVPGAQSPLSILSPQPGQTPRFRALPDGGTPGSVQTSDFLGLTRVDFTGLLEYSFSAGDTDWRSTTGATSPLFVKTPAARDRFFRATIAPSTPPGIDIAKVGDFIRVTFQGVLEMSANGAAGSWAVVPGAQSPLSILSPQPGQTPRLRAMPDGATPGSMQTSDFLGLTRIDFTGLLEYTFSADDTDWRPTTGATSPLFVKTPAARDRFFRVTLVPAPAAVIDIAKVGEFIRVTFQGALEMSANGAVGSWAVVPGAQSPMSILSPQPGQTPRFRATADGATPGSMQTSDFLGLTRVDFTGLLEYTFSAGDTGWRYVTGASSPLFVKTPTARDRFFRATGN
jgi:hypothetical protein